MDVVVEIQIQGSERKVAATATTVNAMDATSENALPPDAFEYVQEVAQSAADEVASAMDRAKRDRRREIDRVMADMVADGMLEPTGEWRPGLSGQLRPVYRATEKARSYTYEDGHLVKIDSPPDQNDEKSES